MKFVPHDYQLAAVKHLLGNPGAALFLEPGLGKTSCTLLAVATLLRAKAAKRVLVVAPLRVCYGVWPKEVAKWDEFSHLRVGILHGSRKDEALASGAQVCTINPEGLPWLIKIGGHRKFDVLVVDESTKFKNRDTQRWQMMLELIAATKTRWILTGTPAPNNLLDLWTQLFICDKGARLGKFITYFRREYFDEIVQTFGARAIREYVPRRDTAQRIQGKIKDVALYMAALDHLKMPKLVMNTIDVTLPPKALNAYGRIEDGLLAQIDGVNITTAQASAIAMKLRQLTGGCVYGSSADEVAAAHTAKIEALVDLIDEQNGQPLLVAVGFQHEAEAIAKAVKKEFGFDVPYLGGGISAGAGERIASDWNAGKLPVLLAHPSSVAHGLNLQAGGRAVCWYTPTWSLEEYLQFNGRVWRQGQKGTVVVHHLVAGGTIDETVIARVAGKDATQKSLLETLKARKKERTK